jgi:hypothetical protein
MVKKPDKRYFLDRQLAKKGVTKVIYTSESGRVEMIDLSWQLGIPLTIGNYAIEATVLKRGMPVPVAVPWSMVKKIVGPDNETKEWP